MQHRDIQKINFTKNLYGYYLAIGIIILGYVFLAIGGADSFTSRTLGPIIMVIGYLIAVPTALLYNTTKKHDASAELSPDSLKPAEKKKMKT
ncbi:hypothetical protein ACFL55_00220 [Candidatus Latescibacterota bacterium]